MFNFTNLDKETISKYGPRVIGVDEVGMGPIAGPICACALMVDAKAARGISSTTIEVNDSKQMTRQTRTHLFPRILAVSTFSLGWVSVEEINEAKNMSKMGELARQRAVAGVFKKIDNPSAIISDWFEIKSSIPCVARAKADQLSFLVACASIVAKVSRDHWMMEQHKKWPIYDWFHNVGYGTPTHWVALKANGITPLHRRYMVEKVLKRHQNKTGWGAL